MTKLSMGSPFSASFLCLQRVADAFAAHVMVRQPVQFGLHQRNELLERALVSASPVAEQHGDLLL